MDELAYIHKALVAAYPGLRFHLKRGNFKPTGTHSREAQTVIVEYDRDGVLAAGGNERSLRALIKPILAKYAEHTTIKTVNFEQYVNPREVQRAAAAVVALELRALVEAGATDDELTNRVLGLFPKIS